jgi:nitroimidazol reductase NimA-like FMN-containing flavoprotein (pyridoxamine 5'-phosphate oxidase superfamily)
MVDEPIARWLEHLTTAECWDLLGSHPVGRIGVLIDSAPEIYPVTHLVDQQTIVFRTDTGSKLRGIDRSPSVCYQVDGLDEEDCTGWSVLVKGRAAEVVFAEDIRALLERSLPFWSLGDRAHWIRIVPREVTGRHLHRLGPDGDLRASGTDPRRSGSVRR